MIRINRPDSWSVYINYRIRFKNYDHGGWPNNEKGYSGSLPLIWGLKFNGHGTNCPIKIFEKIIKDYITWDLHSPCCFLLFPWESHLQSANLTQTIQILPPSTQKLASASLVSEALIRCFQPTLFCIWIPMLAANHHRIHSNWSQFTVVKWREIQWTKWDGISMEQVAST